MPNLPTKQADGRAGGASWGGSGGAEPPREGPAPRKYRSNRTDRRNRTRRTPNRPNRVPPWQHPAGKH
eukprot:12248602-Alexandrium_andersonii.AAC.1